jgi:molybdate-binding protein
MGSDAHLSCLDTQLGRRAVPALTGALAYGLDFVPLTAEQFDLVIPAGLAGSRGAQGLRKVLSSA